MADYGRDLNIGKPRDKVYNVEVQDLDKVADGVVSSLDEVIHNLEKTHKATELILGQEVEEA